MSEKVSVIIPAFHAEPFIARAIKSVYAQSYANWEIVLISDDQKDYREILKAQNVPIDRIIFASTGKTGSGCAHPRNVGLKHASGRIIANLDADDEFMPGKLEIMTPKALEYGYCTCALEYTEYEGDGRAHQLDLPVSLKKSGPLSPMECLLVNCSMHAMVVFDRQAVPVGWPELFNVMEDMLLSMHVYDYVNAIYHCPEALHRYVRRGDSLSHSASAPEKFLAAKQGIYRMLESPDFFIRSPAARKSLRSFITVSLATEKEYERALLAGRNANFSQMLAEKLTEQYSHLLT